VNRALADRKTAPLTEPTPVLKLLKRPELDLATLYGLMGETPPVPEAVVEQVEIKYKYEGYLKRQAETAARLAAWEAKRIPEHFDYAEVPGLSNEVRQKLAEVRPLTLGQASRISGVTPAALAILMVHLKRWGGG
jgi:tRNA uridine 5-carboxymethylaminomethyl modification enzyme